MEYSGTTSYPEKTQEVPSVTSLQTVRNGKMPQQLWENVTPMGYMLCYDLRQQRRGRRFHAEGVDVTHGSLAALTGAEIASNTGSPHLRH